MMKGLLTAVIFTIVLTCCANHANAQTAYTCGAFGSIKSMAGKAIQPGFKNSTSTKISLIWLDYSGTKQQAQYSFYDTPPGGTVIIQTFVTHPWMIVNSSGKCLGIWVFNASGEIALVTDTPVSGNLQPSVESLALTGNAGGGPPGSQSFTISSAYPADLAFAIATDGGQTGTPAPAWLKVSPSGGAAPALILVSLDPGKLTARGYSARIVITVPYDASIQPVYVTVSFTVTDSPPMLEVSPRSLSFRATVHDTGTLVRTVIVSNVGGGGPDRFTVSIPDSIPGMTVSPTSGQVSPGSPVAIEVRIDSQAAASAGYKGTVRFTSSDAMIDVAVSLFVANAGAILSVDQTGMLFSYRQAQGLQIPQVLNIYDLGDSTSSVSFTAEIVNGANWLTLTPTSGVATPGKPVAITATINTNAGQLIPRGYYALVRITANNALNSPQYVTVVLNVMPASAPPEPEPNPRGVVFITTEGAPAPPPQNVKVYASSQMPVNFTAAGSGAASLTVSPASGSITTPMPANLTITANTTGMIRGIYESRVDIEIGAVERSINVTVIVVPSGGSSASRAEVAQSTSCTPTRIVLTETGLPNGFAVPGGFPATLSAVMNDNCGNKITGGSVVAGFSNGDPALSLVTDSTTGLYSGTWQPGGTSPQTTVTMTGTSGALNSDSIEITGAVSKNPSPPPVLAHGGTVNNAFPAGSLSPGVVAAVFGTGLASKQDSPSTVPLPTSYEGTSLLIGASQAPLFFISGGQVNAQLPAELKGGQYSIIASVNGALSLPDTLNMNPVQPGIVAFADGHVIAQHANGKLVKSTNAAKPGETVIIYLVGMGATEPPVASGHAAPSSPLAKVVAQPVVTVDGQNAKVSFAGLTPGGVGLYQIDLKVPSSARNGGLDLIVSQNGVEGNTTKLIVAK
jgi:uncharacterized protein (TIGR03437 family)